MMPDAEGVAPTPKGSYVYRFDDAAVPDPAGVACDVVPLPTFDPVGGRFYNAISVYKDVTPSGSWFNPIEQIFIFILDGKGLQKRQIFILERLLLVMLFLAHYITDDII